MFNSSSSDRLIRAIGRHGISIVRSHPQTLLAYGFNGRPLHAEHGALLRVYSPVKLGYKNVKFLTEINFLSNRTGGYWEDQGYEGFAGV
jgi:DMSO/TMAO reductase YedYZ molybdopterin-dependent catalytic subunit